MSTPDLDGPAREHMAKWLQKYNEGVIPEPRLPRRKEILPTMAALAVHAELYQEALPIFVIPGMPI